VARRESEGRDPQQRKVVAILFLLWQVSILTGERASRAEKIPPALFAKGGENRLQSRLPKCNYEKRIPKSKESKESKESGGRTNTAVRGREASFKKTDVGPGFGFREWRDIAGMILIQ
jgi:hypothetical protein